jgi:hypothetical protein
VPQTSDLSNFRLQAGGGSISRIQLDYLTGFQTPNPAPNGNQHIAFGNLSFTYF